MSGVPAQTTGLKAAIIALAIAVVALVHVIAAVLTATSDGSAQNALPALLEWDLYAVMLILAVAFIAIVLRLHRWIRS